MEMKLWYAVNGKGQGRVFTTKPEREEHFKVWLAESVGCISTLVMMMEADGMELPDLEWSDEPVELKLSLSYG
jgi:hypothetical protein